MAVKPRDAFVQCNGVVNPIKHAPPHVCYHAEFCRLNHIRISRGETPKLGSARATRIVALADPNLGDLYLNAI